MEDGAKSKKQLIDELMKLRQRLAELEQPEESTKHSVYQDRSRYVKQRIEVFSWNQAE